MSFLGKPSLSRRFQLVLASFQQRGGLPLEPQVPADWLWHGRHVKLVDGTTITAADLDGRGDVSADAEEHHLA